MTFCFFRRVLHHHFSEQHSFYYARCRMPCKESLVEEVSEVICLSCEVKIAQITFIVSSCNLFYS
jgi:hypothetical protein